MAMPRLAERDARAQARIPGFALWVIGTVVLLIVVLVLSILIGANPLSARLVLDALRGEGSNEANYVVWTQRIPRTVAGVMVGAALSVAGALVQSFTRNPLADTGLLGVNAGAAFFVAIGIASHHPPTMSGWRAWVHWC